MDYLLFAIEETQEQSDPIFEHGYPAAIVLTILVCATIAVFVGCWIYDSYRGTPNFSGPNIVRANFNIMDLEETEQSRKDAKLTAIIVGIVLFGVLSLLLFLPFWLLTNSLNDLFSLIP